MADPNQIVSSDAASQPPEAPDVERKLVLPRSTAIGASVLLLIVLLALMGVFGESRARTSATSAGIKLTVEYPSRFRYKQIDPMHVHVRNRTARMIDTVTVTFDSTYLDRFSNVTFIPAASDVWQVHLTGVRPGEQRRVQVGLQGEQYGRHTGRITVRAASDTVAAVVSTVVFP